MQPTNPQAPFQPAAPTYLDQIAAPARVKTVNPFMLWGMIGGMLIFIIFIFMAISSTASTPSASLATIGASMANLQSVSEDAQENIQSGNLRSVNSNLTLTLTNSNRELGEILKAQKISLKDSKKNRGIALVAKDFELLEERLEDARLNAVYDRTYAREMSYTIKNLRSDMAQLYKSSRSKALKDVLVSTDESLDLLVESFENFNED